MSTGVIDGQSVNAAVTNAAFLAKNGDDTTTHKLALHDSDPLSGSSIDNAQRELNAILSALGMSANQIAAFKLTWASDIVGAANDTVKARIESIVAKLRDTSAHGGHTHSGVDGDAPNLPMTSLSGVLPTAKGGTGQSSTATFPTTGTVATVPGAGVVKSNGTTLSSANVSLTAEVTGTLPVANGGTGQTTASAAFDALSPNTTKGDITVRGASGNVRVGVGTDGQALVADSTQAAGVKWGSAGGGSGQGGINFLILDTSFGATKTTNSDAETSIGDWAAYADTAGSSPVDMTGGTPNTTIARDTTTPLNGFAHFTMTVSSGATRQGEGVSCIANVPPAYRGRNVSFQFPFQLTGTVTDGDFTLFAYDVTNSTIITPYAAGKILGSSGVAIGTFPVPTNCTQLRVGIHVARATNTGAVTIKFDDVKVSPDVPAMGMAGSDWQAYTIAITGSTSNPTTGTVAVNNATYRRVGDSVEIHFEYSQTSAGTAGSGAYLFSLPPGLSFDSTKWAGGLNSNGNSSVGNGTAFASSTTDLEVFMFDATHMQLSGAGNTITIGSSNYPLSNTSLRYSFTAKFPVAGWSSNVTMAQSSTVRMSSILANGTRVTGTAPAKLGEYRSYLRNASARTWTETNGSPATAPNASDGIKIWAGATAWSSADTANNPTRYDIFIGKNKSFKVLGFSSTGMTGNIDLSPVLLGTADAGGYNTSYDPTTGIFSITKFIPSGSFANSFCGTAADANESGASAYFDIIVSENALAVGVQAPRSSVVADSPNGHGSTGTQIRRWTNVTTTGSDITYTADAVNGDKFVINSDGVYSMSWSDRSTSSTASFGFSLNSANLTTSIFSLSATERLIGVQQATSLMGEAFISKFLPAGSVIRCHGNGALTETTNIAQFSITKVSN